MKQVLKFMIVTAGVLATTIFSAPTGFTPAFAIDCNGDGIDDGATCPTGTPTSGSGVDVTSAFCDPNNDGDTSDAIDPAACGITDAQSTIAGVISTVVQTLVFIVGGLSVVVIVVGGLMYVLSGGDSNNTKRAKDAIMYAIIGLVVALVAQGLVSFVLRRL